MRVSPPSPLANVYEEMTTAGHSQHREIRGALSAYSACCWRQPQGTSKVPRSDLGFRKATDSLRLIYAHILTSETFRSPFILSSTGGNQHHYTGNLVLYIILFSLIPRHSLFMERVQKTEVSKLVIHLHPSHISHWVLFPKDCAPVYIRNHVHNHVRRRRAVQWTKQWTIENIMYRVILT